MEKLKNKQTLCSLAAVPNRLITVLKIKSLSCTSWHVPISPSNEIVYCEENKKSIACRKLSSADMGGLTIISFLQPILIERIPVTL